MSETDLTAAQATALDGTTDSETGFTYHSPGDAAYFTAGQRQRHRLLTIAKAVGNQFRVYQDGTATFGVRAGRVDDGDGTHTYSGSAGNALTDNQTNYVYVALASGALTLYTNTSGFPDPSSTPHIPLATVLVSSGSYDYTDITDYRACSVFRLIAGATAADLNSLTDGASDCESLHTHARTRSSLMQESLVPYRVPLTNCRNEDGTVMTASDADDKLSIQAGGWGAAALALRTNPCQNTTKTGGLCFEFAVPPEYVADEDVRLVVHARFAAVAGGTTISGTVDAEVYRLDDDGTVGSDLNETSSQNLTGSWADYTFTITDTDLAAGDRLIVILRATCTEGGDTGTASSYVGNVELQLDIKG